MFRLDVPLALGDENVKATLPRYVKILTEGLPTGVRVAKSTPADFREDASEEDLWRLHESALKEFRKRKGEDSASEKLEKSLLDLKAELCERVSRKCVLCERRCGIDRRKHSGFCGVGVKSNVFGAHAHFGEESCVSPSATLFFSGCNFRCVFCQNAPESVDAQAGVTWSPEEIADWMERMRECRNVNFVGGEPTPHLPNVLKALQVYEGSLPVVWNSNAYCSTETMALLEGVVDLFLFDFKYFNEECGRRLSGVGNYPEAAKRNHLLAAKQAELLVRLLVLPNHVECDAKPVLSWLAANLKDKALVNVMDQYRPCWKASEFKDVDRPLWRKEFDSVLEHAETLGLRLSP